MKDLVIYAIFRLLSIIINILPERVSYLIGTGFAKLAYFVTGDIRKTAHNNLEMAYGDQLTEKEKTELIKKNYQHFGAMLVEFVSLNKLNQNNLEDYIDFEGLQHLKEAYEKGNGVIIYGAHFGNWEWMAAAISLAGYPINCIAQRQSNSYLNQKINQIREEKGINLIEKGISVRKAYYRLKSGECVYILGDQDAREMGWKTRFFGQPTSTYKGAVQLAQRTGAAIVPTFLIRKGKKQKHLLQFYEPYTLSKDADKAQLREMLQELVDLTESVIRKHPAQWNWLYEKWQSYNKG